VSEFRWIPRDHAQDEQIVMCVRVRITGLPSLAARVGGAFSAPETFGSD
jgi:hypothetical protein